MMNATKIRISAAIVLSLLLPRWGWAQNKTVMPDTRQTILNSSGLLVNGSCVWTYLAGTTTPVATYTDQTGNTPSANPIIASGGYFVAYLTPGVSYKFTYESTPCNSGLHGPTIYTQDNIAAVPTAANNVSIIGTAAQTLNAGTCVYLSDGSGSRTSGQFYSCDATNAYSSTGIPIVGLVQNQITAGNTGSVIVEGYLTGLSSLTVGATYYASTAGAITTTAPANARKLGQADTASSLVLKPDPPYASPYLNLANAFLSSSTTLTDTLSATLAAGRTYNVRAVLHISADATGGIKVATGGTAVFSSFRGTATAILFGPPGNPLLATASSPGAFISTAGSTFYLVTLEGSCTVLTAGTLTIQFAQSVANGTSTLNVGSSLVVY